MNRTMQRTPRFLLALGMSTMAGGLVQAFDPATQDDSLALVRHFAPRGEGASVPEWEEPSKFDPAQGETICLAGGAPVAEMQRHGFFEVSLQRAFPDRGLKVRNLGWAADTVYRQQRPMFFYTEIGDTREGSVPDQREKLEGGILILRFGKMESLEGVERLPVFRDAYEELLEEFAPLTRRIVLVAPEPFFGVGPAAALAEQRNRGFEPYVVSIRELAEKHALPFVDLFHPLREESKPGLSRNGIDLTESGQREVAAKMAEQLGLPVAGREEDDEELRGLVLQKNLLWDQYYRPTNWAFLFGDRQHVPSSRDHRDVNRRWFIEELEKLPGLVTVAESEMSALANRNR